MPVALSSDETCRLVRRYIDFCADYAVRRRNLLSPGDCRYTDFFFGHVPLINGVASVNFSTLTAGAPMTIPSVGSGKGLWTP